MELLLEVVPWLSLKLQCEEEWRFVVCLHKEQNVKNPGWFLKGAGELALADSVSESRRELCPAPAKYKRQSGQLLSIGTRRVNRNEKLSFFTPLKPARPSPARTRLSSAGINRRSATRLSWDM